MSVFQLRKRDDGAYEVVDVRTGQVRFTGSASGAVYIQAELLAEHSRRR